ncbi:MAG: MBL fold metallo-hydrolase [Pseudomonadota bacterium]
MSNATFSRRSVLAGTAALPAAGLLGAAASPALAGGHAAANANKHTFAVGDMEVATLLVGQAVRDNIQSIFGMNVSAEEFEKVSSDNFLPSDKAMFFFTPTVVKSGDDVVLFDTGLSAKGTLPPLAAAGYQPEDVDIIVITHMHGDHIGGLTDDAGNPTYPNARYVTGQTEFDAWASRDNERFDAKVRPFAEKMTFIGDGASVVSGITAMAANGHTPGHMIYMLESGGKQLAVCADTANHYVWSLAYPDWEVKFDMDKAAAAATRKQVFGMLAADKIPFIGYHMPFPGMGYVETGGEGMFRYVPVSYQMSL